MNETVVELPVRGLAAVLPFVAKDDVRYYLCGVLVEVTPEGVLFVGTNGHVLAVAKCECENNSDSATFILSSDDAASIVKNIESTESLRISVLPEFGLEIEFGGHRIKTSRIDAKFPDWRTVAKIENDQRGQNACFNPAYLALVHKAVAAAKKFGGFTKYPAVHVETNGAARAASMLVVGDGIEIGFLIMPLRDGTSPPRPQTCEGLLASIVAAA